MIIAIMGFCGSALHQHQPENFRVHLNTVTNVKTAICTNCHMQGS